MQQKRSKRYRAAAEQVDRSKPYNLNDAVATLKKFPPTKFDQTVTVSFRLGVDPKQSDQMVRGTCPLPHGSGKQVRVLVFAEGAAAKAAREAGAEHVGFKDMIQKCQEGFQDFDVAVATPAAMAEVRKLGNEFGATTGRPRRCGWLDAALLKRSIIINGISGLCITKLDVLDGLKEIKVCVGYELNGKRVDILPLDADDIVACKPIYDTFPGWTQTTAGITEWDKLPVNARKYLERVEEFIGAPIDMVSTGPDREETIVMRHPYDV